MSARPRPPAVPFPHEALAAARAAARERDPEGRRLRAMRWAVAGGAVWQWPAALPGGGHGLAVEARLPGNAAASTARAFWLATAARQDLWRALRRVPGLLPVVAVGPAPDAPERARVLLGCVLPAAGASPAVAAVLARLAASPAPRAWAAFAARRARVPGRVPNPLGPGESNRL